MTEWLGPISHFVGGVGRLLPWALRWYYTVSKLNSLLIVEISSCGEGASYNYASQEAQCWITVTNLSPFDFTVETLRVTISLNGGTFVCATPVPEAIAAGSRARLIAKDKCPVLEADISLMKKNRSAHIEFELYLKSKIRSFSERRHIADMRNVEIF